MTGPAGRRAAARRARRRQRRQLVAAVLAVAVVATLLVTVFFVRRDTPPPAPAPAAAAAGRTQTTLLLQLRAATGEATSSVLLAHDPAARAGAGLLVPSQVLAGPVPFGSVLRSGTGAASRRALQDLVGVTVDAGWVLDSAAAALLVDAVGGVEVTVDVTVPVVGGPALVPGPQVLTGPAAVAFATALAAGEAEPARLARLRQLVDGVLARLPDGQEQVSGVLAGLGTGSVIEGTMLDGLGALLAGLAADGVQAEVLPVLPAAPGAVAGLDAGAAGVVVERLLAGSRA